MVRIALSRLGRQGQRHTQQDAHQPLDMVAVALQAWLVPQGIAQAPSALEGVLPGPRIQPPDQRERRLSPRLGGLDAGERTRPCPAHPDAGEAGCEHP